MSQGYSQHKVIAILILTVSITIGSLSVTGLLQSTERVGSSGIVVLPAAAPPVGGGGAPPPSPPPPEPTVEIDVYSDPSCTQPLSNVVWGEIEAGDSSSAIIYVKNNGDTGVYLSLDTENWTPSSASNYMDLSWNYDGTSITSGQVRTIVLALSVDSGCPALSSFNFNIVIIGS